MSSSMARFWLSAAPRAHAACCHFGQPRALLSHCSLPQQRLKGLQCSRQPACKSLQIRCCTHKSQPETVAAPDLKAADPKAISKEVRVRFAPSPTGSLHVGGARTALYNWLYAKQKGGKLILRIEDTDAQRSTAESEADVLRDLKWLGLDWDEGPDVGGSHGPYRQTERKETYLKYVDQMIKANQAYPCFCTDEELDEMRRSAEAENRPPVYNGKWASASAKEVEEMKAKGVPFCYRCRVVPDQEVVIPDLIRGDVTFNTSTLGDFVILRSNGLPVYNFAVAVDDALMNITHVLRAEEHLPNTLRQVIIYSALGFEVPLFGHVSLILAPDHSKLSKRHGAASVGDFERQGYLPDAMVNFLALLGWNDGSEKETFTRTELIQAFSLERVHKGGAVFDQAKLTWMNGHYLRDLPDDELVSLMAREWTQSGLLGKQDTPFVREAALLLRTTLQTVKDADVNLRNALSYPLEETLASSPAQDFVQHGLMNVVREILSAHNSGELEKRLDEGADGFKKWISALGKQHKLKGKGLWMPVRIALTGSMEGAELAPLLAVLRLENGDVQEEGAYLSLQDRLQRLQQWSDKSQ